jgi:pantoate--beta-alanine ligase
MQLFHTIQDIRQYVADKRAAGRRIGFVPTMGYLHAGHLSLVERGKREADIVIMSIFVNPLQFGPNEDLDQYPRDLERDLQLAETVGVDAVFAPSVREMYPHQQLTFINTELLTDNLCGASRPGHFRGVTTVVGKLFNIVQPDKAFFGQKDAQQVRVIQQMVADLNMPVAVIGCPIVREADGLAMSSRNVYLSPEERRQALILNQSLTEAQKLFEQGERSADVLTDYVSRRIQLAPFAKIDYVKLVDLQTLSDIREISGESLLAVAVRFGGTRLIDNIVLQP